MGVGIIQNTIGRWFDIPWVGGSIYHGFGRGAIQNTIGRWFDMPWIGGSFFI
jgi:hypothetical protein